MQITGTTHPPAGATALLAAVNQDVTELGWYVCYLDIFFLASVVLIAIRYRLGTISP